MKQTHKQMVLEVQEHPGVATIGISSAANPYIVHQPALMYDIVKRGIDMMLAFAGIIVLLPVFLLIALAVKCDDQGPVFHFREITGLNGKRFYALKFRTMIVNADTFLQQHPELMQAFKQNMKLSHDPRITRLGVFLRKTSLDELPQLFNVLIGQMSLVGPRMIHPSEVERYGEYAQKRLSVKPGITGLWQISGRQHVSYAERIVLDMQYIDTRTTWLDVSILLKTFKVFIVHTGA